MILAFILGFLTRFTLALSICRSCDAINNNITFLTPNNSQLPVGTYIAANFSGATQLADYLDANPTVVVENLLLSDSTLDDLASDFGYLDTYYDPWNRPDDAGWKEIQHMNAMNQNTSRALRDHGPQLEAVVSRIMDRISPTLKSLVFLNYIRLDEGRYATWHDNRTRTMLDRAFPKLTHLTIRDFNWNFKSLPGRRRFFRSLPSVTHLHIISNGHPSFSTVHSSVRNATHIRSSGHPRKDLHATRWLVVQWSRRLLQAMPMWAEGPIQIIQPDFGPSYERGQRCGNPRIAHRCMLARLARNRDIHLSVAPKEDYTEYAPSHSAPRLFPLRRAITEFEDRVLDDGEGEWIIPSVHETDQYRGYPLSFCP